MTVLNDLWLWPFVLLIGPVCSVFARRFWNMLGPVSRRIFLIVAAVSIVVAIAPLLEPWSLRGLWPQDINLTLAFWFVCCLLPIGSEEMTSQRLPRLVRTLDVLLSLLTIFAIIVAYHRTDDLPAVSTRVTGDVTLRRTGGGWAGISWEGVTLVRHPRWMPLLERSFYSTRVGLDGTCGPQNLVVEPITGTRVIRIRCGEQAPFYWDEQVRIP